MISQLAGSTAAAKMKIVVVKSVISPLLVLYQIIKTNIFALNFVVDYLFISIISWFWYASFAVLSIVKKLYNLFQV